MRKTRNKNKTQQPARLDEKEGEITITMGTQKEEYKQKEDQKDNNNNKYKKGNTKKREGQ